MPDLYCKCGVPMEHFRETSRKSIPQGIEITRTYYCEHCGSSDEYIGINPGNPSVLAPVYSKDAAVPTE